MSKPWSGEQTPITDDIARGNHVVPTELAHYLEQRLRNAERLLADPRVYDVRYIVKSGYPLDLHSWNKEAKHHLAAAKEADQ